jgi:hypothetical protein
LPVCLYSDFPGVSRRPGKSFPPRVRHLMQVITRKASWKAPSRCWVSMTRARAGSDSGQEHHHLELPRKRRSANWRVAGFCAGGSSCMEGATNTSPRRTRISFSISNALRLFREKGHVAGKVHTGPFREPAPDRPRAPLPVLGCRGGRCSKSRAACRPRKPR